MFNKLPIILIILIILSVALNPVIPMDVKRIIYAISLSIKSLVLFFLPIIIFGLLFKTFVKLSGQAARVIFLIFGTLCTSNFIATFLSHYVGSLLYCCDINLAKPEIVEPLKPYFEFELLQIIKNDYALFSGIVLGIFMARFNMPIALRIASFCEIIVSKLMKFLSYLIPMFIVGFVIKCASEGILISILKNYSQILCIFLLYASFYISMMYLIVNKFNFKGFKSCLYNMFPVFITAFSTVSSALTMPVTIMATEKNVKNTELASSVISATVNIHLMGDCVAIPILAYALLKTFGLAEPSLYSYLIFTCFFVIAKFSVAAVPAGGIIIMAPILEKYLNFSPEMSSLIIAIYVIFDPFVTGFNVLGNGALAKLIDDINFKLSKRSS